MSCPEWPRSKIVEGARKLICEGLRIKKEESLIFLAHEQGTRTVRYLVEAADSLGMKNLTVIQIPEIMRPITKVPTALAAAISEADGLLFANERIAEEGEFGRQLQSLCVENKCKYCFMNDPEPRYLGEGVSANYEVVESKCKEIARILKGSKKINVTSNLGTSLTFRIYDKLFPRGPAITPEGDFIQAPEGEVTMCPIETTFSGKLVVDGPVTNMGRPKNPIEWIFKNGQVTDLEGDEQFISKLLADLRVYDKSLQSLVGIWIAEFAMGANQWAVLDNNLSNCEKVAGTVHFAMGRTAFGIGVRRGEKYHFDNIVTAPSVEVTTKSGEKKRVVETGRLLH